MINEQINQSYITFIAKMPALIALHKGPRSLGPFYIATHFIKLVKTQCPYSMKLTLILIRRGGGG